ncbi:MAG: hypothetical protein PVJ02_14410, partial [Gemmatimonadota bacterium]
MNPRTLLAAAVLCVAAASCSEPTAVEPKVARSGMASLQFSPAGAEEVPVRYLVVFKESAPKRFETQVAQLGGTVLVNHAIGVAVVEGLNDATAAELQERTRALYVVRDAEFRLLEPAAVGQPELTDASMSEPL